MIFPDLSFKSILHRVLNIRDESTGNTKSPEVLTIYVGMPYDSDKGLSLPTLACTKFTLIAPKTRSIRFMTQYDVNKIEFYCNMKDKTAVLCNSLIVYNFLVLVVVPITSAKQNKRYMNSMLNMLGLIITVLYANISKTVQVSNISLILRMCICNC